MKHDVFTFTILFPRVWKNINFKLIVLSSCLCVILTAPPEGGCRVLVSGHGGMESGAVCCVVRVALWHKCHTGSYRHLLPKLCAKRKTELQILNVSFQMVSLIQLLLLWSNSFRYFEECVEAPLQWNAHHGNTKLIPDGKDGFAAKCHGNYTG